MAAFLIGAGILIADRVVEKRKLKKQAKRQQQEQLEDMQAATARRHAELEADRSHRDGEAPPSYEELYGRRRSSSEERRTKDESGQDR